MTIYWRRYICLLCWFPQQQPLKLNWAMHMYSYKYSDTCQLLGGHISSNVSVQCTLLGNKRTQMGTNPIVI